MGHFRPLEFCPRKPPNPNSLGSSLSGLCTTKPILNQCLLCARHCATCLMAWIHIILQKPYKAISILSLLPFPRWISERWSHSPTFTHWQSLNLNPCHQTPKSARLPFPAISPVLQKGQLSLLYTWQLSLPTAPLHPLPLAPPFSVSAVSLPLFRNIKDDKFELKTCICVCVKQQTLPLFIMTDMTTYKLWHCSDGMKSGLFSPPHAGQLIIPSSDLQCVI